LKEKLKPSGIMAKILVVDDEADLEMLSNKNLEEKFMKIIYYEFILPET
jgi:response regulator RpfG family c-di-GMP phosphodiesterase